MSTPRAWAACITCLSSSPGGKSSTRCRPASLESGCSHWAPRRRSIRLTRMARRRPYSMRMRRI
ncbi:Uncharacterised protein [Bordetella pertussis]|nr:Uncharacterised protein [Bordetella pertussis]